MDARAGLPQRTVHVLNAQCTALAFSSSSSPTSKCAATMRSTVPCGAMLSCKPQPFVILIAQETVVLKYLLQIALDI